MAKKVSLQQPVLRSATYIDTMSDPGITRFLADREHVAAEALSAPSTVPSTPQPQADSDAASDSAPDLDPAELFETLSQCLMAGIDRDCLSGWGGVVHILTPAGVTTKLLKTRMD